MCIRDSIHTAEIRQFDDIVYCNDGDWVESCTALVEHLDGTFEILRWADIRRAAGLSRVETAECKSSLSPTLGFLRSTASSERSEP